MARFFSQQKIDEFKECFYFHAKKGQVTNEADLSIIMRSLFYSPTKEEVSKYFKKHVSSDGRIDFASFLDIMHEHSKVENCARELLAGFTAQDVHKRGYIPGAEMKHILMNLGEKLSRHEVDSLFQSVGLSPHGQVPYNDFVKAMATPVPDY
ncbi:calmodulin-like protein 4 [Gigantopelta aegis]|uniref:calmodulin-like protein 4 n=1 Tax=Gigantopelta aegis TaxID=1735272 RepID=UPI001B88853D|nr:calmodulin-like protein 4 [Gigantopelta aegis]